MNRKYIHVQPSELKFPFQINRASICWLQLTNKIDHNVAFKVKTTHPKKYSVRPNVGIILPGSTFVVKVTLQAQKEFPGAVLKDKFLVQSMISPDGLTAENITSDLFRKDNENMEELKLRVVFVTADPPSPIAEVSEEDCSPDAAGQEIRGRRNYIRELFDSALTVAEEVQDRFREGAEAGKENEEEKFLASESTPEPELKVVPRGDAYDIAVGSKDWNTVSKLIEERSLATMETQELQYELELIRRQIRSNRSGNVLVLFALLVCLLGFLIGYLIK